jgi:tRNA(Glu) U13 pseudouridine synthase TruD
MEHDMGALAKQPERLPEVTRTPMELLNQAVMSGNIELAEKLMGLQERYEQNQARKAFDNAMAQAKAEMPIIVKDQTVDFSSQKGRTN